MGAGHNDIFISDITAIQFKKAGNWTGGFIPFSFSLRSFAGLDASPRHPGSSANLMKRSADPADPETIAFVCHTPP
jgi:hypothetical protein